MRAFLCSIDESVWDAVDVGWTRPEATKSIWDKAALVFSHLLELLIGIRAGALAMV